ncbi:MAG: hypothetical protein COB22_08805 [Cycloclasticus sp.]|nr:MAG: hypothetical protein COB22_08805 [Cycloclasticus sp.]
MPFTLDEERELPHIISGPRFATYLRATNSDVTTALSLYQWNLELSAAFIVPLQVCEIAARNGVVLALEARYGANWHLSQSFIQSLPNLRRGYNPRTDFTRTSSKLLRHTALTPGKIVADIKFAFWENMLTSRHDQRLWTPSFSNAFPHADFTVSVYQARGKANTYLEKVRGLRNRIAHHEPIFTRNIIEEYNRILEIVRWRSPISADWLAKVQEVTVINGRKPIP